MLETDHIETGPARTGLGNPGMEAGGDTTASCPHQITTARHSPNRRLECSQWILSLPPHGLNAALEMDPDTVSPAGLEAVLQGVPADGPVIALARP